VISKLPERISNSKLLGTVAEYDLNALEERLRRKRDILILDSELAHFQRMRTTPTHIFEKAALIIKTCYSLPALKTPAKDCLSQVREWIELLPTVIEVFQSLAPAFQILQLSEDFNASGIESIALCVIFASDLKDQQRQWLARGSGIDEARFSKFDAQRSQITKRDAEWRRQFLSYRYSPWPSPEELRDTAKLLRQGLLQKTLSIVKSGTRKSAQIAKTLGYTGDSLAGAEGDEDPIGEPQSLNFLGAPDVGPLTEEEATSALEVFRDSVIAQEVDHWERQRSILRDSMIELLIKLRVTDPRDWIIKIPHYQRSGTNQIEKNRYLGTICQIVERVTADSPIELGETEETEFKSTLRVNMESRQKDSKIEFTALRAMASLLNSNGGKLIIGVSDDGRALGLDIDGFDSEDKMSIHLNNLIHERIGSHHSAHIRVRFEDYDGARIMVVACSRARLPVFLKDNGREKFFIRNGTATRELSGTQQVEYIRSRFGS
jgi:Putative DNA-binding domain